MSTLIVKRSPLGWNQNDFDVVENGVIVGRIFFLDAVGPFGRPRGHSRAQALGLRSRVP
jgi:hypothetical protein